MLRVRLGWLGLATAAFAVAAWIAWDVSGARDLRHDGVVSEEDAHYLFDQAVEAALARNWDQLCSEALTNAPPLCEMNLQPEEVKLRAPGSPPVIASSFGSSDGHAWHFVVCGRDAQGDPYQSDVIVARHPNPAQGGDIRILGPVFWAGTRWSRSGSDEEWQRTQAELQTGGDRLSTCSDAGLLP